MRRKTNAGIAQKKISQKRIILSPPQNLVSYPRHPGRDDADHHHQQEKAFVDVMFHHGCQWS